MADVRRDADARAGAVAHPAAPAVPHRVERRPRHADRVPRGRRRRRRVHRQRARDDPRDLDALRPRALAARHAVREDGVVAGRRRARARLPHDGRPRVRARPRDRARLRWHYDDRLAGRVVADRAARRRLLRRLERPALRPRPAHAPAALDALARREDHLERRDRGRHALHRRLRRPALGALAAHRRDALGRAR